MESTGHNGLYGSALQAILDVAWKSLDTTDYRAAQDRLSWMWHEKHWTQRNIGQRKTSYPGCGYPGCGMESTGHNGCPLMNDGGDDDDEEEEDDLSLGLCYPNDIYLLHYLPNSQ